MNGDSYKNQGRVAATLLFEKCTVYFLKVLLRNTFKKYTVTISGMFVALVMGRKSKFLI
jgi:hypothetical protein